MSFGLGTAPRERNSGGFSLGSAPKPHDADRQAVDAAIQHSPVGQLVASGYKTAASGLGMAGQVLDTPRRAVSGAIGGTIDNGGNVLEGVKSAIGDTFHPNDTASLDRHVDVQRGSIDPNYYNQIDRVNDGTASLGEKASVLATRFGTETAEDPFTYGTLGIGGLVRGAARMAEKVAPAVAEGARDLFDGSYGLDKAGITGNEKRGFQSIEESEHQKYLKKHADITDKVVKNLKTNNPALAPEELKREPSLFDHPFMPGEAGVNSGPIDIKAEDLTSKYSGSPEAMASAEAAVKKDAPKVKKAETVEDYAKQGREHLENMKKPAYADAYNAAVKMNKDFRTSMKAGRDTLESQDIHVPKTEETFNDAKPAWANHAYAGKTEEVPIDWIKKNVPGMNKLRYDPSVVDERYLREAPEGTTESLVDRIKKEGVKEPLIIDVGKDDHNMILGEGNHRLEAAARAGLTHVPVRILRGSKKEGGAKFDPLIPQDKHWNGDMKPSEIIKGVPVKGAEITETGDKAAAAAGVQYEGMDVGDPLHPDTTVKPKAPGKQRPLFVGATEQDRANHIKNMANPAYANEYNILVKRKKGVKNAIAGAVERMRQASEGETDKAKFTEDIQQAKAPEVKEAEVQHLNPNKFGKSAELQREPNESNADFAHRTFLHHLQNDSDLYDNYERGVKEKMSFQEAASNAYREKYLNEYEKNIITRAHKTLGIDPQVAQAGVKALKTGDMKGLAKFASDVGNAGKATMFINWLPHVFGNVAQNTFLSGGAKTLAKAVHYTMNDGKNIPDHILEDMKEAGATHSGFDKFDPTSEHLAPEGLKKIGGQIKRGYGKATSFAQDKLGSTYMMNHAEQGARAASWEDNAAKYMKEQGKTYDQLTNEDKLQIGSMVRRDIGDYRNPNRVVRFAKERLGAEFPQYRAIALGVSARAAMKNPRLLEGIYRSQDETNKAFNADGKVNLNLGGVANAANKAVSTPSEYVRGDSAVGPLISSLLNIGKQPDNYITGSQPGSDDYGKGSYMQEAWKAALEHAPGANIPGLSDLIYSVGIRGNDQKTGQEHLIDILRSITGINQKHKMTASDEARLENWQKNGGDMESDENAPRNKPFSF